MTDEAADAFVHSLATDWTRAALEEPERALCTYAEKLTLEPTAMTQADVQALREAGFGDPAIHDAVQVVSYFNYINRVADAVHVDLEASMPPYADTQGTSKSAPSEGRGASKVRRDV